MAFNVSTFRSAIAQKGVLKTNKFKVSFDCPMGLRQNTLIVANTNNSPQTVNISNSMEFWCEAATIPGYNIQLSENRRYGYGPMEKKPVTFFNTEAYFSIIGDANGDNYRFFRNWLKLVVNGNSKDTVDTLSGIVPNSYPYDVSYKDDYFRNVEISVYSDTGIYQGTTGTEVLKVTLRDAFPTNLGDITMNWADNNAYMRIPISFSYFDTWTSGEYTNSNIT